MNYDLRSSLLTLGKTQTSMALLSLNRSLDLLSSLLTLGKTQTRMALLSLNRSLDLLSSLLTLGKTQTSMALLSLNRSLDLCTNFRVTLMVALMSVSLSVGAKPQNIVRPAPCPPLPRPEQVAWQKMETYAFIHFGPNTFTDKEWGYGDVPAEKFNPTQLDCEQWAKTLVAAGMKGVIITAKHHDGFCLWPTKYTDYSVRNTPWMNGKGDVVGQLAQACKKYGLRFGVYLSPWDRHQAYYGTPLYPQYYRLQMEELLTSYGSLFEVWLDGANGGDGWYGGAREERKIDREKYYNYPQIFSLIKEKQPQAIIFSDGGPGCRWVGNENGHVGATNWSFLRVAEVYPGYPKGGELFQGHADGDGWVAAECDVSIRPGWFYHKSEDDKVKTVDQLCDIYYQSVGHNGTMLLNFPVDDRGLIHPTDSAHAVQFFQRIQRELGNNLLLSDKESCTDGDYETFCILPEGSTKELRLKKTANVNRIQLQEYIPLGQRVKAFKVEYYDGKKWTDIDPGEETTTIGYKRILRFPAVRASRLRLTIQSARADVCLSEFAAFYAEEAK